MYFPPKLSFFIKKCFLKLHNLLYVFISIVLLNYPFSLKNIPQISQFAIYTYMYCPPKLTFFIKKCPPKRHKLLYILICIVPLNYHFSLKNVPLNFVICYMYLYALSS